MIQFNHIKNILILYVDINTNISYRWIALCRSVFINSNTRYKSLSLSALWTFRRRMIFGWSRNSFKNTISRNVRCASVLFRNASNIFLTATTLPDLLLFAFQTIPYAPLPSLLVISYLLVMCWSISRSLFDEDSILVLSLQLYHKFVWMISHNIFLLVVAFNQYFRLISKITNNVSHESTSRIHTRKYLARILCEYMYVCCQHKKEPYHYVSFLSKKKGNLHFIMQYKGRVLLLLNHSLSMNSFVIRN